MPLPDHGSSRPTKEFDSAFVTKAEQQIMMADSALRLFVEDPFVQRRLSRQSGFSKFRSAAAGQAVLGSTPNSRLWLTAVLVKEAVGMLNKNRLEGFQQMKAPLKLRLCDAGIGLMELHPGVQTQHNEYRKFFEEERAKAIAVSAPPPGKRRRAAPAGQQSLRI